MASLLRNPGVVHDPPGHRAVPFHLLQNVVAGYLQDSFLVPRRIRHEVVQGLMPRPHVSRIHTRGYGLDALTVAGQAEADQIGTQRLATIGVPQDRANPLHVLLKPIL
jgi:hypothetical protein